MSLTREKCNELIEFFGREIFWYQEDNSVSGEEFNEMCDKYVSTLKQLINEHFDNPPLKREELENMIRKPIWDNKYEKWVLLRTIIIRFPDRKELELTYVNGSGKLVEFEENRFYRREVKENDHT